MNRTYKVYGFLSFLVGLGCKTQIFVFGCIGISELILFVAAPIVLFRDFRDLRRDGFLPIVILSFCAMVGCVLSGWINHSGVVPTYKAFAMIYSTIATIVVMHRLLKVNPNGLGLYVLGYAISSVITIWAFHPKADVQIGFLGAQTSDELMGSVMFWIKKVREFAIIPICLWYLRSPSWYSVAMPVVYSVYCMAVSSSGRSMALGTLGATILILIGGKCRKRMRLVSRHLLALVIVALLGILLFKGAYKYAALNGYMGEVAYAKYLAQSKMGDSALKILISGRKEFFISLPACIEHPILGLGPRPMDEEGYVERFLSEYGTPEELRYHQYCRMTFGISAVPCHSYITSFWLWFGIAGLLFWGYVIYLNYLYFRRYISDVPQWYGYFALNLPMLFWDMFFSPYNWRVNTGVIITALLIVKAIGERRMLLPWALEQEARRYD